MQTHQVVDMPIKVRDMHQFHWQSPTANSNGVRTETSKWGLKWIGFNLKNIKKKSCNFGRVKKKIGIEIWSKFKFSLNEDTKIMKAWEDIEWDNLHPQLQIKVQYTGVYIKL